MLRFRVSLSRIFALVVALLTLSLLAACSSSSGAPAAPARAEGPVTGTSVGPCPGYPTPACTGVPAGTRLRTLDNNVDGTAVMVTRPGQTLDRVHVAGDLVLTAPGTTITNSQIDGRVVNEVKGGYVPFTIADSTVGPPSGCVVDPAVGEADYRAERVQVRNSGDGFRVAGDDVDIRDSFALLCSRPGFHSDGIQDYPGGDRLVFRHNTVDQRDAPDHTAPVFVTMSTHVMIEDNLVMGGTSALRVEDRSGRGEIRVVGNQVVDGTWDYTPADADCGRVTFVDNELVRIGPDYRITATLGPVTCS